MRKTIALNIALMMTLALLLGVSVASAQTSTPQIKVTLINQDPDPVEQGDSVEIRFKIENTGVETLDNVLVQILPDYPFSLYSGKAVQEIGKLRAGQSGADSVIARYQIKVDENAANGNNEIKLQLKTGEGIWQIYTDSDFFVDVKDYNIPGIQAYLKDSTISAAGQRGKITIEIANTDLEDVKFLQMALLPGAGYQILSPSNYIYIGNVDSDGTETEEFDIYVDKNVRGKLILPVSIKYQDTNKKKYEKSYSLDLRVFSNSELSGFGIKSRDYTGYILAAIFLAALGFFYYRSRRKARR